MKLSDAMALGFTLVRFDPNTWLTHDGSCGCALGGAIEAAGRREDFSKQVPAMANPALVAEIAVIRELWPWLTVEYIDSISLMAWKIADGELTREQLLTFVRSIEPNDTLERIAEKLPDISLEEQHRLELLDAERESLPEPTYGRRL